MASSLARSSLNRAVRVEVLAADIVLCSWVRHFTFTMPLSVQIGTGEFIAGITLRWTSVSSRGEYKYS